MNRLTDLTVRIDGDPRRIASAPFTVPHIGGPWLRDELQETAIKGVAADRMIYRRYVLHLTDVSRGNKARTVECASTVSC